MRTSKSTSSKFNAKLARPTALFESLEGRRLQSTSPITLPVNSWLGGKMTSSTAISYNVKSNITGNMTLDARNLGEDGQIQVQFYDSKNNLLTSAWTTADDAITSYHVDSGSTYKVVVSQYTGNGVKPFYPLQFQIDADTTGSFDNSDAPGVTQAGWNRVGSDVTNLHTTHAQNGRLMVFAFGRDGIDYINETSANSKAYTGWASVGVPPTGGSAESFAVATDKAGKVSVFSIDPFSGELWVDTQRNANSNTYTGWKALTGSLEGGNFSVIQNQAGKLEVMAINSHGNVVAGVYDSSTSKLTAMTAVGQLSDVASVSATLDGTGEIELAASTSDGDVDIINQTAPNGSFQASWSSMPASGQIVMATDSKGAADLFTLDSDGNLDAFTHQSVRAGWNENESFPDAGYELVGAAMDKTGRMVVNVEEELNTTPEVSVIQQLRESAPGAGFVNQSINLISNNLPGGVFESTMNREADGTLQMFSTDDSTFVLYNATES